MDLSHIIIFVLVGVIILQQWHIHLLMNKLMSRDFHDYVHQKKEMKKEKVLRVPMDGAKEQDDLSLLNQLI